MKTRRRKVLVPVRTPGSGRQLGSRGGRRRESAPALRVYWDIAEGAARVDADGDSADYELSSSGDDEDATQAPEPILDLSPDVASKPPDGSVNPLGTPEPLPEFEALPEEVREALTLAPRSGGNDHPDRAQGPQGRHHPARRVLLTRGRVVAHGPAREPGEKHAYEDSD